MPIDPKRKRWASCGTCNGCVATDCGDCINCMDKSKFGGQGVRKQSCIKRRCARMNSNGSFSNSSSATISRADCEPYSQVRKTESEQALFWAAVSGCMALHADEHADDDAATVPPSVIGGDRNASSDSDSCPRSPTHSNDSSTEGSRRDRDPYGPESTAPYRSSLWRRESATNCPHTGPESFCNKLASVLASDSALASQPVGLRALRRAGVLETHSPTLTSALTTALTSSLSDPTIADQLRNSLAAAAERPPNTPVGPVAPVV